MQDPYLGQSRKHTQKFITLRKEKNDSKKDAIRRINARLKLEMHYLQQDKETKTANSSLMGSFFGLGSFMGTQKEKNYVDSHGVPIDLSKIPGCIQWDDKVQCPACKRIVCNKCLNSKYCLPIPQSIGGKLEVCVRCHYLKNKESSILEFKKKIEEARNDRLILCYNTIISLRKEIENLMPDFSGLVFSLTENNVMIDELSSSNDLSFIEAVFGVQEKANEHAKNIEKHFQTIQERLDKMAKVEALTKRDEQIKKLIRIGTGQYLSKYLPEFQSLSVSLKQFMENPILIATVNNYHLRKAAKIEKEKLAKESNMANNTPSSPRKMDKGKKTKESEDKKNNSANQNKIVNTTVNNSNSNSKNSNARFSEGPSIPKNSSLLTQKNSPSWFADNKKSNSNNQNMHNAQSYKEDIEGEQKSPRANNHNTNNNNNKKIDNVAPVLKPLIESVKPAVVPCSGEVMIDIEGINFELGLEIIIAGVRIGPDDVLVEKNQETDKWHVFLEVPPCEEEGPKTIILINPNKCTAILENVLLYVNDPEILKEFQERENYYNDNYDNY